MVQLAGSKGMPCVIMQSKIMGVVLAGGQSQRMGQNKALLDFKGKPLWLHALHILQSVTPKLSKIVVSGRQLDISCIPDIYPKLGPLGGIYSVLQVFGEALEKDGALLIIPIDMPLLTVAGIHHLLIQSEQLKQFDAVNYQNTVFPLFLRFTQNVQNYFTGLVQHSFPVGRTRSIQNMLEQLLTCRIPYTPQDKRIFTNVNTTDEWQQLYECEIL